MFCVYQELFQADRRYGDFLTKAVEMIFKMINHIDQDTRTYAEESLDAILRVCFSSYYFPFNKWLVLQCSACPGLSHFSFFRVVIDYLFSRFFFGSFNCQHVLRVNLSIKFKLTFSDSLKFMFSHYSLCSAYKETSPGEILEREIGPDLPPQYPRNFSSKIYEIKTFQKSRPVLVCKGSQISKKFGVNFPVWIWFHRPALLISTWPYISIEYWDTFKI